MMMFKRILCLLAVLLLALPASAEPRYPEKGGVATDAAGVLSAEVLEDLRTLDKRLDKADVPQICLATVDFLDTQEVQAYADALFDLWNLDSDEMLLLICVGEESYAISAGRDVDRLLSATVQEKLLTSRFREPFLDERYDAAISAYIPALVSELSKACGETVRTDDLFDSASDNLLDNWARNLAASLSGDDKESIFTREDRKTGFSLLKVIVIVVLLVLIFGSFRRVRKDKAPRQQKREPHVYFKPHQQRETTQYFGPRRPRR